MHRAELGVEWVSKYQLQQEVMKSKKGDEHSC